MMYNIIFHSSRLSFHFMETSFTVTKTVQFDVAPFKNFCHCSCIPRCNSAAKVPGFIAFAFLQTFSIFNSRILSLIYFSINFCIWSSELIQVIFLLLLSFWYVIIHVSNSICQKLSLLFGLDFFLMNRLSSINVWVYFRVLNLIFLFYVYVLAREHDRYFYFLYFSLG